MEGDSLYDRMKKRVVAIQITPAVGEVAFQSGIIMDCGSNFAYIITYHRQLMGAAEVTVLCPGGRRLNPQHFLARDGVVGMLCYGSFGADLFEKVEIYDQPLVMSQEVLVYEGVFKRISDGNITLFFGDHFSHNCAVAHLAKFGAPVITKNGQLVGICDSGEYQLNAKKVSSLLDTIRSIKSDLDIKHV